MVYTGWTFEQVGNLTMSQMRSVMGSINRRRKEQIEMLGGKVSDKGEKKMEFDGTVAIEQRLQMLKKQTGKEVFDLREVI